MAITSSYFQTATDCADSLFYDHGWFLTNPLNFHADVFVKYLLTINKIYLDLVEFDSDKICGMLLIDEHETTIVYNTKQKYEKRGLFTISHELGHYYLHRNLKNHFADRASHLRTSCQDALEKQANVFAARILLPTFVLHHMLKERFSFFDISDTTKVSKECLKWRLVNYLMVKGVPYKETLKMVKDYIDNSKVNKHTDLKIFRYA